MENQFISCCENPPELSLNLLYGGNKYPKPVKFLLLILFMISCSIDSSQAPIDCFGITNGTEIEDICGVCGGNAISADDCVESSDCAGTPNGNAVLDDCGTCDTNSSNDCVQDCFGTWGGNAVTDACGLCGGDTNSEDDCSDISCDSELCIYIVNVDYGNNSLDIWMINSVSVAGFQFDITGISPVTVSGGLAEENGLTLNSNNARILGFSLGGAAIPSHSNGILIHITFTDTNITDAICVESAIFSDSTGTAINIGQITCFITSS